MLKERREFIRTILYVVELVIVSAVFFLVYYLAYYHWKLYSLDLFPAAHVFQKPRPIDLYLRAYWLALVIWAVLFRVRGEYHQLRIQTYHKVIVNHLVNGLIFFFCFSGSAFLFKFEFLSRVFTIVYTICAVLSLILNRLLVLSIAYYVRRRGHNYRNLLVVGTGRRAQDFLSLVAKHKEWGYRVVGLMDKDADILGKRIAGYQVLGSIDGLPKLLEQHIVDEVVFVVPRTWLPEIEKCILYCEAIGVPATLSTDFFDLEIAYGVPKEMEGFTFLTFETRQLRDGELLVKRTLDLVSSAAILALTSPLFLVVAVGIKLTSKGPVFFKQIRCGRNGRKFMLYKFRSMVVDAESRLAELKPMNEMSGPVFKVTNDPRMTGFGRFLRKTSLDEFPQFWNVLKGDMSLVGPRPPIPSEVDQYEPWQRRRLSMKPGITCVWQVSARHKSDFDEWMRLDLQYIDRWSLWLDFKILLLTARVVLAGTGR